MFKQNKSKFAGYRILNCTEKAGGEGGNTPPPQKTPEEIAADEILKGVELPSEKLELIKKDPDLLKLLGHTLKAKREANNEAKTHREKLEKLEADKKLQEEEALKKKGEYETLYNKRTEELNQKDSKLKDFLIDKEVGIKAVELGIKKASYLKLLDRATLEVDMESLTVKNVESTLEKFKADNPDFFGEAKKIEVNSDKPNLRGEVPTDDEITKLEKIAMKTRHPRDIAAWHKAKKDLESKK